ncbi:MAG TPA: hypothetical protein VIL35_06760 [Vicinamibacterales bacterium]
MTRPGSHPPHADFVWPPPADELHVVEIVDDSLPSRPAPQPALPTFPASFSAPPARELRPSALRRRTSVFFLGLLVVTAIESRGVPFEVQVATSSLAPAALASAEMANPEPATLMPVNASETTVRAATRGCSASGANEPDARPRPRGATRTAYAVTRPVVPQRQARARAGANAVAVRSAPETRSSPATGRDAGDGIDGPDGLGVRPAHYMSSTEDRIEPKLTGVAARSGVRNLPARPLEERPPERVPSAFPVPRGTKARVEVVIDERGRVVSARVQDPGVGYYEGPLLSAAKSWRYLPARVDGRAIRTTRVVDVELP